MENLHLTFSTVFRPLRVLQTICLEAAGTSNVQYFERFHRVFFVGCCFTKRRGFLWATHTIHPSVQLETERWAHEGRQILILSPPVNDLWQFIRKPSVHLRAFY